MIYPPLVLVSYQLTLFLPLSPLSRRFINPTPILSVYYSERWPSCLILKLVLQLKTLIPRLHFFFFLVIFPVFSPGFVLPCVGT